MSDYKELVEELRSKHIEDRYKRLTLDTAAAIEGLVESVHIRDKQLDELNHYIWKLEAEVKRLNMRCADCEYGNSEWPEDPEHTKMPKRGEWIYKPKDAIEMMFTLPKCSVCGHESSDANNYCPNCGARMNDSNGSNALNALDNAQDGPIITPCRGCSDYDGYGGCKSKGGCARAKMEVQE